MRIARSWSVIRTARPASICELANITGRKQGNLSRTLKTMSRYGLVKMEKKNTRCVRSLMPKAIKSWREPDFLKHLSQIRGPLQNHILSAGVLQPCNLIANSATQLFSARHHDWDRTNNDAAQGTHTTSLSTAYSLHGNPVRRWQKPNAFDIASSPHA